MIKLFTNKKLLIPEHRSYVHPLLFDLHYYENTHPSIYQHYVMVDKADEADFFIFPIEYFKALKKGFDKEYQELYHLAVSLRKKIIVYTGGDYGKIFKDKSIITFRNGGFKSTNDLQTIVIPSFMNDPLEKDSIRLRLHSYQKLPQISFTGFANPSLKENLRWTISTIKANLERVLGIDKSDQQFIYNAALRRFKYLKKMESHDKIITDFIYRDKYRAGAVSQLQREKSTEEFFENLNNSPYTFCLRGAGNFSVRFYESLASGRIPVLIDTDVQLPLENQIDWDQHICRILPNEDLCEKLISFHNQKNIASFEKLQLLNRNLYENYLVRHAYFCKLHDVLLETT
jgi:hypothetical protein